MQKWISLRTPSLHIEKVVEKQSEQQVMDNRLQLTTTIEGIGYLAHQALAFQGHDESVNSSNQGNFVEIIKSFARINIEVEKVVLDKAPQNAQYIAHDIQKQILHIFANKVRKTICKELEKNKFGILVDESDNEQMTIILRFVDCDGFIRERFFNIVSVVDTDTNALTLKNEICKMLGNHDILVENMRDRRYDDASNMHIILRFFDCDGFIHECFFFDIVSLVDTDTNALTLKNEICKVLGNNDILVENMRDRGYDDASHMHIMCIALLIACNWH